MLQQSTISLLKSPWYWSVPLIALISMAALAMSDSNQSVFMVMNSVLYTGSDYFWVNVTLFGDAGITAVILLPLLGRRTDIIWAAIIAGFITAIVVNVGKSYFELPRPPAVLDAGVFHQLGNLFSVKSFPSGHTAAAFTVAAVVVLSISQTPIKIVVIICAVMVGLSRIAVGAHWPMDVFAGAIVGWLPSVIGVMLASKKVFSVKYVGLIPTVILTVTAYYLVFVHQGGDVEARFLEVAVPIIGLVVALPGFIKIIKND